MKRKAGGWIDSLRRHLVLTAAEWRIILFVVGTLVLGLMAKHYRAVHSDNVSKIEHERIDMRDPSKPEPSKKSPRLTRKRKSTAPETSPGAAEPFDD